ncbi:MAG TPA: hypothetical protein VD963_07785 [Phycisphaerales bacterium]|nr:hypothetical protein [Phycisphaerales bacterium]
MLRRPFSRRFAILAAPLLGLWVGGCAFREHRADLERLFAAGEFDRAAAALDDPKVAKLYGENDRLLLLLDRGAVALATDRHEEALRSLEEAERLIEHYHGQTLAGTVSQWLLNDTAAPYVGEPYEDLYINVLKLAAQLERGNIQGGATVEARRLASKADLLRDRYLRYREQLRDKAPAGLDAAAGSFGSVAPRGGLVTENTEGRFVESTLGTFLTAVTFMFSGDTELQRVAGRRLEDAIRLQQGLIGTVDPAHFAGVGEREPAEGTLLLVALSGRGPTKEPESFGPVPVLDWPVYFELPVLTGGSARAARVRAVIRSEGGIAPESWAAGAGELETSGNGSGDPRRVELPLIEDMRAVAIENHRRHLPLVYTRALVRSSLKAGASFAVTQAVRREDEQGLLALASVLAGLAAVALTERADLRTWVFLPAQAHAQLVEVPPGEHLVRLEYLAAGGGTLMATPWRRVRVPPRGLATIVEHYWQ